MWVLTYGRPSDFLLTMALPKQEFDQPFKVLLIGDSGVFTIDSNPDLQLWEKAPYFFVSLKEHSQTLSSPLLGILLL